MIDVLVVGGGPAGRALASACGARGLRTTLVDRSPGSPWLSTYGAWTSDLPAGLPAPVIAARATGRAVARTAWGLGREYAVLDVPALRADLDDGLVRGGVDLLTGRVVGVGPEGVELADGTRLRARTVVDAGGHRQPTRGTRPGRVAAEQTAHGVVVGESAARPLVAPGEALFMDWRADHGEPGWPTFLYAVPLGGGRVLLEETSLARRPGLPQPVLRRRLLARLARHGIAVPADAEVERVRFPVDTPRLCTPGVVGFGAAAPLVHPASGFSIATSLGLAPAVADALASGGTAAAEAVVWSPRARGVHRFRRIGLEALLRMPPDEVAGFFEVFFALPERHRWAYLSGRDDLAGTAAVMGALFRRAGWRLRTRLVGPALMPPAPALRTADEAARSGDASGPDRPRYHR
ncbi:MAG: lycopene beta-cyclase [Pseudonocardiales bacterium]|jgi:lycopene beta-cyclase|nr:lycopene beta-cyclase [Pseudonocardiales bacterium]